MRAVGFGDDEEPRGLLVEAMNHAGPLRVAGVRYAAAPPQQGVHEGPRPVAGSRVNYHSSGLVHYQQRLVFKDDADGDVFAGDGPLLHFGDNNADDLARLGSVARFFTPAVDQDVSLGNQSGCLGSRELGTLGNKEVEADIAVRLDWKLSDLAQT